MMRPIDTAPKDGTVIRVLQRDSFSDKQSIERVLWKELPNGQFDWGIEGADFILLYPAVLWEPDERALKE